jgi:hypothetical protein
MKRIPDRDSRSRQPIELGHHQGGLGFGGGLDGFPEHLAVVVGSALDLLKRLDQLAALALDERLDGCQLGIEAVSVLTLVGGGDADVTDKSGHLGCS